MDICNQSLAHCRHTIAKRSLRLNLHMPQEAEILTPPSHIDILVRNLMENAVKYCSVGGLVEVNIDADGNGVRLEISNDFDQPMTWKPEEFFEPFSRWDPSRNPRTGGTGLGLAICKSIADANEWQLDVFAGGSRFSVMLYLPLC